MCFLDVQNLGVSYDAKHTWQNISFCLEKGKCLGIVGESGIGKTTILKALCGLQLLQQGTITLDGQRIDRLKPNERKMAMVFQDALLLDDISVYDNIGYGCFGHTSKQQLHTQIHTLAKTLGIEPLLTRYPQTLSAGQKQRVSIARALLRKPKVLLFDEPLANLDDTNKQSILTLLKKLLKTQEMAFIYVSHDEQELKELVDDVLFIQDGQTHCLQSLSQVFYDPQNLFVATYFDKAVTATIPFCFLGGKWTCFQKSLSLEKGMYTLVLKPEHFCHGDAYCAKPLASKNRVGSNFHWFLSHGFHFCLYQNEGEFCFVGPVWLFDEKGNRMGKDTKMLGID